MADITNAQLFELINDKFQSLSDKLDNNIRQAAATVEILQKENTVLKEKVRYLERHARKNNVAIFGLDEVEEKDLLRTTLSQLNKHLKLDDTIKKSDVNNIYKPKHETNETPVILELTTYLKKTDIFRKVSNLKDTGIIITHDLTLDDRKVNKILRKKYKEAKAKNIPATLRGLNLTINGKVWNCNNINQLVFDLEEDSEEEEQVEEVEVADITTPKLQKKGRRNLKRVNHR